MAEIILSLLLGLVLGLNFTGLGLISASVPLLVFTLAGEIVMGSSFWWALIISMCAFAAVQVGYVGGALLTQLEDVVKDILAHPTAK